MMKPLINLIETSVALCCKSCRKTLSVFHYVNAKTTKVILPYRETSKIHLFFNDKIEFISDKCIWFCLFLEVL